jgi:hypothetical protein
MLSLTGWRQNTGGAEAYGKVELKFWNVFDDASVFKGRVAYESKHRCRIVYRKLPT